MTCSDFVVRGLMAACVATWSGAAWAGACCAGSTTTIPTRLGECEKVLGGVGLSATGSIGRWDAEGTMKPSSLGEQSFVTTLAAGYRWDRKGQIGLTAPVWVNHKNTGDTSAWGGGLGDLRLIGTWDPLEESMGKPGSFGVPVPVVWGGVRLPTGRSPAEADGVLFEDVTGLGPVAVVVGADVERSLGLWPWALGVDSEIGVGPAGVQPVLTAFGSFGRYFGTSWSVIGSARHTVSWVGKTSTARSVLGARVIYGQRLLWRGWAGVEADLPLPVVGRSAMRQVSFGAGVALVR